MARQLFCIVLGVLCLSWVTVRTDAQEFTDWTYVSQFPDPPWNGSPYFVGLTAEGELWGIREIDGTVALIADLGPGPWVALAGNPSYGYMLGTPHCLARDGRVLCVSNPVVGPATCVHASPHPGPWTDLKKWNTSMYALDAAGEIWFVPPGTQPWQSVERLTPGPISQTPESWAKTKARFKDQEE